MKERLQQWLAVFRAQPPSAQMAAAGLALLLSVLLLSEIWPTNQVSAPAGATASATPESATLSEPLTVNSQALSPSDAAIAMGEQPHGESQRVGTFPTFSSDPAPQVNGSPLPSTSGAAPRLVIILDDIGYSADAGQRAIDLPGALTYAVLPFTPHGRWLAEAAHRRGKDVMLHAPMSNQAGMDLGPGGITLDMDEACLRQTLRAAIADIPHIRGVNNHTGSELTTHRRPMEWVMQELQEQGLFFVDSLTHSGSVAGQVANEYNVPTLTRHVFLDNVAEAEAIAHQFNQAIAIARRDGLAVAIGHPYSATLEFLEKALPALAQEGIELTTASALLAPMEHNETPAPLLRTSGQLPAQCGTTQVNGTAQVDAPR